MKTPIACLLALVLCLAQSTATAKTVWRCGAAASSYSDSPCTNGRAVDVADPRSAADVQNGRDDTQRMQALADRMRSQRLADEAHALAANRGAANLGPSRVRPPQLERVKTKAAKKPRQSQTFRLVEGDGTFQAVAARSRRTPD
jgi:hypothetical protein